MTNKHVMLPKHLGMDEGFHYEGVLASQEPT